MATVTDKSMKPISLACSELWSKQRRIMPICRICTMASVVSAYMMYTTDLQRRHNDSATYSRSETKRSSDWRMRPRYTREKRPR